MYGYGKSRNMFEEERIRQQRAELLAFLNDLENLGARIDALQAQKRRLDEMAERRRLAEEAEARRQRIAEAERAWHAKAAEVDRKIEAEYARAAKKARKIERRAFDTDGNLY